ncbi:MAG TPA: ABC transporter ATP-binding protein [Acidisarcina sp.]
MRMDRRDLGKPTLIRSRRLLAYLTPYRWLFSVAMLISAAESASQLSIPWLVGHLIDNLVVGRNERALGLDSVALSSAALCVFLFSSLRQLSFTLLASRMLIAVQTDLAKHMQCLPLSYTQNRRNGDIASLFTNDAASISGFAESIVASSIMSVITFGASLFIIGATYHWAALLAIAAIPLYSLPSILLARPTRVMANILQVRVGAISAAIQESLDGRREIKSFNDGCRNEAQMAGRFQATLRPKLTLAKIRVASSGGFIIFWCLTSLLYWIGGRGVLRGQMSIGLLTALITYIHFLRDPFSRAASINSELQSLLGASDRIYRFLDEPYEDDVKTTPIRTLARCRGQLTFDDVTFAYDRHKAILSEVSLSIPEGQTVAVVGANGAGKSTLVLLIAKFLRPTSGRILMDAEDTDKLSSACVREQVAAVFQQPFIFSTTIRENIRMGRPGATNQEIVASAVAADAHSFIISLPAGYDTELGEHGNGLSGGQKQRIAIARALVRGAPILLLDEATSEVDSQAEAKIFDRMRALRRGGTTLIVAHRLVTIVHADSIIMLEGGKILDVGSHVALIERCKSYRNLFYSQGAVYSSESVG